MSLKLHEQGSRSHIFGGKETKKKKSEAQETGEEGSNSKEGSGGKEGSNGKELSSHAGATGMSSNHDVHSTSGRGKDLEGTIKEDDSEYSAS